MKKFKSYQEWLFSEEGKNQLAERIKSAGTPLEIKASHIFTKYDYTASRSRYEDQINIGETDILRKQFKWRELDIQALKLQKKRININGCNIQFFNIILAECKYSTNKDVIVFSDDSKTLFNFPLFANGQKLTKPTSIDLDDIFELPLSSQRIIETDFKDGGSSFSDATIHQACEQLLPALKYKINYWRDAIQEDNREVSKNSTIIKKWQDYLQTNQLTAMNVGNELKYSQTDIINFLKKHFNAKMVNEFPQIIVFTFYPIIIFDENTGIIQATLDKEYNVNNFNDIGKCLYLYFSEHSNHYENITNKASLPIFVCNLNNLASIIELIDKGTNKIIEQTTTSLKTEPYRVPQEVCFNDEMKGTFM